MNKFISLVFLGLVHCSGVDNINDSNETQTISGASYGTTSSRVQFRNGGGRLKVSYQVGSFDNVSGPTYEFDRQDR